MTRAARTRLRAAASLAIVAWSLLPVAWIASLSVRPGPDLAARTFLPGRLTLEHYRVVLSSPLFLEALRNSVGVSLLATAASVGLAAPAAWAVARLAFPGRRLVLWTALAVSTFPAVALVSPLFDLWRRTGLYDTWPGLVLAHLTFGVPLALWILTAFFREVPRDPEQAARLEGAAGWQVFRHVTLPLAAPGLVTAAILVFLASWNDFLFGISLTSTGRARPVPAALAFFSGGSQFQEPAGAIAAAAVLVTVPVVALVLASQRRIVAGLTAGAVKG
ncbi:MAG: carbohydrate ABC transporter permease [Anaeromyxobacter sp.]